MNGNKAVVTVLMTWAICKTVRFVVHELTTPAWDKACKMIRDGGYDIVPKPKKVEEETDEIYDEEVVEDAEEKEEK